MLSIAIFSECYHPMRNGVVVSVDSFAHGLMHLGHQVTIFTPSHPEQGAPVEGVYRYPSITFPVRARYPIAIPLAPRDARRVLQQRAFDIIHSHSPMMMGQVAAAYHRQTGIPLVFTYHTLLEEYAHYIPLPQAWVRQQAVRHSRQYCNDANHVVVPGNHVAARLRHYRVDRPITVIPTGIDLQFIDQLPPTNIRHQYHIPARVPLLVYAGRLAKEKNMERVLGAFRLVRQAEPEAHLLLIGGGPYDTAVHELIEAMGLATHTRLTGFVPREMVMQGMREADLFVFASLTETQGLVLGEAMACGTPVVAVESAAARELLQHGEGGRLAPDADAPFAETILDLLRDNEQRAILATAARRHAETLSVTRCAARLVDVYQQAIAGVAH